MYESVKLKNGLTLITINLPHLESITTMVAVGAGSRYETKSINGLSHFLEHMAFKGTNKYPSAKEIADLVDGIGAVNNAGTDKEYTFYWIKSAAKHVELASDILSSMVKEPLLSPEEIEKEKGVIIEELRMYKDNPTRYVWDLYESMQFGDQPIGWDIGGDEKTVRGIKKDNFEKYLESLYNSSNMAILYVGKLPKNIKSLAEKYFAPLPARKNITYEKYKSVKQTKPKVNIFYKKTDQANLIFGMKGYSRRDEKRHIARLLGIILGEGMSSRLFSEIREKRGLAYHVSAGNQAYLDTGFFAVYSGLKLERIEEGVEVIKAELERMVSEMVTDGELEKAKEMERGRIALRSESTNFLAEHFGVSFILDRELETFDEYLKKIDKITKEDIQEIAKELFKKENYNLQIIAPLKNKSAFERILNS